MSRQKGEIMERAIVARPQKCSFPRRCQVTNKDWEDVKDDMNGAYTKALRCGVWTVECDFLSADHVIVEIFSKRGWN